MSGPMTRPPQARRGQPVVARLARVFVGYGFAASSWWMTAYLALSVGTAVASVLYPIGIRVMVDAFLAHHRGGVILGTALVAGLYALQWILSNNGATAGTTLADHVNLYLSTRIAALVNRVASIEHLEHPEYLTELQLLDENRALLANGPRQMIMVLSVAIRIAGVVVLLGIIWWPLALLPAVTALPVTAERLSVRIRQRSDERVAEERRLANELFDITASAEPAKELRIYGLAPELARRHHEAGERVAAATSRAAVRGAFVAATGWLAFAAGFGFAVVAVAVRAAHGESSPGEVVLAVTLVQRAQFQVAQAANAVGQLLTMARTASRLFWIEDYAAHSTAQIHGLAVPGRLTDGIRLDHVSFRYPDTSKDVLTDVSLHLPAGAAVALVGVNGAGKTTLVKLLTRMYEPTGGRILVDGMPLADLDLMAWRKRTAAAFQDFLRPELSVAQVVGIGEVSRVDDHEAVGAALARAGATGLVAEMSDGLQARIGRSFADGTELSGGQWQKLALGRSMMRDDPLLLVLDEPTANLDAPAESALFDRFIRVARQSAHDNGAITLLVSHRFSTVAFADLIIVLENGRPAEWGSHAELMALGGTYAELYEMQAATYR
jgi:ATP-binding cassette, subfamily B, bacterial